MSDFARPQKSRRAQEIARLGRPIGFAAWSNEENRDVRKEEDEKKKTGKKQEKNHAVQSEKVPRKKGMIFLTTSYILSATKKNIFRFVKQIWSIGQGNFMKFLSFSAEPNK